MGKILSRYLSRASDIFKEHRRCLRALHVQIPKRMGKIYSDSCVPKVKIKIFNFELLVPSKVQLQKSGTVFHDKNDLLRNAMSIIAYWKTVCEYAREVRYVVASFRSNCRNASDCCSIERVTGTLVKQLPRKRVESVLTIRLLLNSEQSQADLRGIKRTSVRRQYYLANFSRVIQVL